MAAETKRTEARGPDEWGGKYGFCAAFSLTILEFKRFLFLALEILIDSKVIRLAGGRVPVISSFVDASIGIPVAMGALYAVRGYNLSSEPLRLRLRLRRLVFFAAICALLNSTTIILIACYVNLGKASLQRVFRTSMSSYASRAPDKIVLDDLQFELQCCGCTGYADWFFYNWQTSDYYGQEIKEEFVEKSVPYSCCKKHTLLPCVHIDMQSDDIRTINTYGCTMILRNIILKIVIGGYTMTILILILQILMIVCFVKMIKDSFEYSSCNCWESACSLYPSNDDSTWSDRDSSIVRRSSRRELLNKMNSKRSSSYANESSSPPKSCTTENLTSSSSTCNSSEECEVSCIRYSSSGCPSTYTRLPSLDIDDDNQTANQHPIQPEPQPQPQRQFQIQTKIQIKSKTQAQSQTQSQLPPKTQPQPRIQPRIQPRTQLPFTPYSSTP